jgi:putative ABC transport system permease protein
MLANLIAWPVAYYAGRRWLQGFAYQARCGIELFLLAAGLSLLIALFTVAYQTLKAARANPVDALRYE